MKQFVFLLSFLFLIIIGHAQDVPHVEATRIWTTGQDTVVDLVNEDFESGLGNFNNFGIVNWTNTDIDFYSGQSSATSNTVIAGQDANLGLTFNLPEGYTASVSFFIKSDTTQDQNPVNTIRVAFEINGIVQSDLLIYDDWTRKTYYIDGSTSADATLPQFQALNWKVYHEGFGLISGDDDLVQVFLDSVVVSYHQRPAIRIADGSEGFGKVLTSDAQGNASWRSLSDISIYDNPGENFLLPLTLDGKHQVDIPLTVLHATFSGVRANHNNAYGFFADWNEGIGFQAFNNGSDGFSSVSNDQHGFRSDGNALDGFHAINNSRYGYYASGNGNYGFISTNHYTNNNTEGPFAGYSSGFYAQNNYQGFLAQDNQTAGFFSYSNGTGIASYYSTNHGVAVVGSGGFGISVIGNSSGGIEASTNSESGFRAEFNQFDGFVAEQNDDDGFVSNSNVDIGFVSSFNGDDGFYSVSNGDYGYYAFNNADNGIYAVANVGDEGYFSGTVTVTGALSKGSGSFKIDHPLDPENKFLYHSFVESPDMMNIYNGNVILDANGEAVVHMEDWFQPLNRDFRYQLTAIGAPGPDLYIAKEIQENQFKIAGGSPGMKVSWQVTGIRQDPYAEQNRIQVEVEKPAKFKGYYLHPEAYGRGFDKGFDFVKLGKKTLEQLKTEQRPMQKSRD